MPRKKKEVVEAKKDVIEISDFFTTSREKEGVWIEPEINGVGLGVEFKVVGQSSPIFVEAISKYMAAHNKVLEETDIKKAYELETEAQSDRSASIVVDLRAKPGVKLEDGGEALKYSPDVVRKIMYEITAIRDDVWEKASRSYSFMKK